MPRKIDLITGLYQRTIKEITADSVAWRAFLHSAAYQYLDNDFAGQRGAEALQIILGGRYEVRYLPPPVGKDYNDYLMTKKQIQIEKKRKETYEISDQKR